MVVIGFGILLAVALVTLALIDLKTFILPDILTLPLIGAGLGFSYFQNDIMSALIGATIGYVGFVALELIYKRTRGRDGLGRGDAKLVAAGGAWCGWFGLPFIILIASGFGLVHALLLTFKQESSGDHTPLPFGPHLAVGIFLTWLALFVLT